MKDYQAPYNVTSFWQEVKKIKGSETYAPATIDNISGDMDIADHFASKFKDLYNCVSYSSEGMSKLMKLLMTN